MSYVHKTSVTCLASYSASKTDAEIHSKANLTPFYLQKGSQENNSLFLPEGLGESLWFGKYSLPPPRLCSQAQQHSPLFHTSLLPCAQTLLSQQVSAHRCTSSHGCGCWTAGTAGCTQSGAEEQAAFMDHFALHPWLSKATQGLFQIFFMSRITFSTSELATKRHSHNWGSNSFGP